MASVSNLSAASAASAAKQVYFDDEDPSNTTLLRSLPTFPTSTRIGEIFKELHLPRAIFGNPEEALNKGTTTKANPKQESFLNQNDVEQLEKMTAKFGACVGKERISDSCDFPTRGFGKENDYSISWRSFSANDHLYIAAPLLHSQSSTQCEWSKVILPTPMCKELMEDSTKMCQIFDKYKKDVGVQLQARRLALQQNNDSKTSASKKSDTPSNTASETALKELENDERAYKEACDNLFLPLQKWLNKKIVSLEDYASFFLDLDNINDSSSKMVSSLVKITSFIQKHDKENYAHYLPYFKYRSCQTRHAKVISWTEKGDQWGVQGWVLHPHGVWLQIQDNRRKAHDWKLLPKGTTTEKVKGFYSAMIISTNTGYGFDDYCSTCKAPTVKYDLKTRTDMADTGAGQKTVHNNVKTADVPYGIKDVHSKHLVHFNGVLVHNGGPLTPQQLLTQAIAITDSK